MDIKKGLLNYKINKVKIRNLELEKEIIESNIGLSGIQLSEKTSNTYKISDITGDLVCDKLCEGTEKIEILERKIAILKMQQERINNLLEVLTIEEREIIQYKFINNFNIITWQDVANRMSMSYGTVKNAYNRALGKMEQVFNL